MKNTLIQNEEFLTSIGLTIVHSLWIVSLMAGMVILLLKLCRLTAKQRYNIVFGTQILSLMVVLAVFVWSQEKVSTAVLFQASKVSINSANPGQYDQIEARTELDFFSWNFGQYSQYLGFFWIVGMTILSLKKFISWQISLRLRNKGLIAIPDEWKDRFNSIVKRTGLKFDVSINISTRVNNPILIGYFKPLILVPLGFFSELSPLEVESVILHELAHIKRNDYLHLFIQHVINLVLFYHPAIWLLYRIVNQERENACDDFVVNTTGDPKTYVKALGHMQLNYSKTQNKMAMNLLNDKNSVLNRLKRLVGEEPQQKVGGKLIILPAILFLSVILLSFSSQKEENNSAENEVLVSEKEVYTNLADTSILTIKEVKAKKVKEAKNQSKSKIKIKEVKEKKKNSSTKLVLDEVVEQPVEIIEEVIEIVEESAPLERIVIEESVEEIAIVEEVPEIIEVIVEEVPLSEMADTIPSDRREKLLKMQVLELKREVERLKEVNDKELRNAQLINIYDLKNRESELIKKQQEMNLKMAKSEMEQSKIQQENEQELIRAKTEELIAQAAELSSSGKINYDDLFKTMNKDGLKIKYGKQIDFKVDKQHVYLEGRKLSNKLTNKYREVLEGYILVAYQKPGDKSAAVVIKMTPQDTIVKLVK